MSTTMSGYDGLVEFLHRTGVESTVNFQNWFDFMGGFLVWLSVVFDPMLTYTVYFPLLYHLNRATGLQILWAGAVSEWLNHVFKCVLFGERPYWWVLQNSHVWQDLNLPVPVVVQTPITCETGPGSPSGHVMVNAAVGFVLVKGLLAQTNLKWLKTLSWTIYFVWLVLIAISRVYIAAHFPHQCFFGCLSGVCLGYILWKLPVIKMKLVHQLFIIALMAVITLGTHLGLDPGWTITLAKKWCFRADWVHLNTTLFYTFWRYMGTVVSIALIFAFRRNRSSMTENRFNLPQIIVLAIGSVLAVKLVNSFIVKNTHDMYMVYSSACVVHILLPIVVIEALPLIVLKLSSFVSKSHDHEHYRHHD